MAIGTSYRDAYNVTPADAASNNNWGGNCFVVGVAGDVTVVTEAGTTVLFKACPVGFYFPITFKYIKSTGTAATNIVALQ